MASHRPPPPPLDLDAVGLGDEVEEILDDADDIVLVAESGSAAPSEESGLHRPVDAIFVIDRRARDYAPVSDDELSSVRGQVQI